MQHPIGLDIHRYKQAMSRWATPVTIVATDGPAGRFAQTVSAFSRIADNPCLLGVAIQTRSAMVGALVENGSFTVSVLPSHLAELADSFANRSTPARAAFAFHDDEWRPGHGAAPLVVDAVAAFECDLAHVSVHGSHHFFLGQVHEVHVSEHEPLLYRCGRYRTLDPLLQRATS